MILQVLLWAGSVIALCLLVWAAYYAPLRRTPAVVGSFIATIGLTFASYFLILSHPAPIFWTSFAPGDKTQVLGVHFQEGEGIFMLVIRPGEREPEYFKLAWDRQSAQQLQKALKEAERNDTAVEMLWPEEQSLERRKPQFHALPQPAMPPKQPPEKIDPYT